MQTPNLENLGSLITYNDEGTPRCLGYLMDFTGHGVFDANYGKVEVSPEHASIHNKLLDEAMLKGLDESCAVGQGGTFYYVNGQVTTFMGTVVSENTRINGKSLTFQRGSKTYRGRLQKDADCFNFRRVA